MLLIAILFLSPCIIFFMPNNISTNFNFCNKIMIIITWYIFAYIGVFSDLPILLSFVVITLLVMMVGLSLFDFAAPVTVPALDVSVLAVKEETKSDIFVQQKQDKINFILDFNKMLDI